MGSQIQSYIHVIRGDITCELRVYLYEFMWIVFISLGEKNKQVDRNENDKNFDCLVFPRRLLPSYRCRLPHRCPPLSTNIFCPSLTVILFNSLHCSSSTVWRIFKAHMPPELRTRKVAGFKMIESILLQAPRLWSLSLSIYINDDFFRICRDGLSATGNTFVIEKRTAERG